MWQGSYHSKEVHETALYRAGPGFTKTVSSGRAIYINNLVTVGPSKPVLTACKSDRACTKKEETKEDESTTTDFKDLEGQADNSCEHHCGRLKG